MATQPVPFDNDTDEQGAKKPDADGVEDLICDAKETFETSRDVWAENHREGLDDIRFARLEEQWPEQIRRERELDDRPCLTLNQLHAFIFQVVNDARQNKPGINVHPVGGGADPETAEIFNGLIRHIEQSSDADVSYDTAMDFAVSGGFGYFRINTRYTTDDTFEQDLAIERIANPFAVFPDPHSTAADSSDWNVCDILDVMPVKAFEARWPDKEACSFGDEVILDRREQSDEDMVTVCEHWTRDQVKRTITAISAAPPEAQQANPELHDIVMAMLPDSMIIGMDVYTDNKALFTALGMAPVGKPRDVMTYKVTQRILSGSDVLETVEWAGKYIPIVPVWGEELNIEGRRVFRSLIRGAKDAQRMFNYWKTTSTELVALAPKAPFIGKVGTFDTDAAKWATANTQTHAYIEYDGNDAPERQPFAGVPAGAVQEANSAQNDIMSIIGVYKSSLGAQSNETSGVAINARDTQADTGTFHFKDNLSRAIRHAGRILLDLIPKVYSTARILRILGPDGTSSNVPVNQPTEVPQMGPDGQPQTEPVMGPNGQPMVDPATGQAMTRIKSVTKVYDLTAGSYDLVVKAGPGYATQREQLVATLTEMVRAYPAMAPLVMDLIVKNYDMPDADEIVQRLQRMMPAQETGDSPEIQQGKQLIQKLQQKSQMDDLTIAGLKAQKSGKDAYDHGKLEIDAFSAQTDRLQALSPGGMPVDPAVIQVLVMQSLKMILQNPNMLIDGEEPTTLPPTLPAAGPATAPGAGAPPAFAPASPAAPAPVLAQ